jgi:hypothetical protein
MEVDLLGFFSDAFFGKIGCLNFQFIRFDNLTYYRRDFTGPSFFKGYFNKHYRMVKDYSSERGVLFAPGSSARKVAAEKHRDPPAEF